jgi:predicted SprT family Zn-dependent metalloprotease
MERELRRYVRLLRDKLPPLLPVRVYLRDELEDEGQCHLITKGNRPSSFSIYIRRQGFRAMLEILSHEWAHALAWSHDECGEDHDASWGIAYARVYRYVIEGYE